MVERALNPSQEQAVQLKKCSKEGNLTLVVIESILVPLQAKPKKMSVKFDRNKYFPQDTPKAEIDKVVIELLEEYSTKNKQAVAT